MKVVPFSRATQALKDLSHALDRQRAEGPRISVHYTLVQRLRSPASAGGWTALTAESFDTVNAAVAFLVAQQPTALSQDGRHWWTETHDYVIHTVITPLTGATNR